MASESMKFIIECDGDQHFGENRRFTKRTHSELLENDIYKMKQAVSKGYRVMRMYQGDILKLSEADIKMQILQCFEDNTSNVFYISIKCPARYNLHKSKMASNPLV
jgi:very-short-patch-repair endonuclease